MPTHSKLLIRVIVADDHTFVRETLGILLDQREGVEVVAQAANGREAVTLCETHQPQLAIVDWRMPELDGGQATCAIKQICPQTTIVGVSLDDFAESRMLDAGADYFFDKASLLSQITPIIERLRNGPHDSSPNGRE